MIIGAHMHLWDTVTVDSIRADGERPDDTFGWSRILGSLVKEIRKVARSFPDLFILLGHFAMANREGWQEQLSLAEESNIYIESGGITWFFHNEGPPFPGAQEVFRTAVERVDADKLMWGQRFSPNNCVFFPTNRHSTFC